MLSYFTYAGHVILQLILYKLCSKMLLYAFQPIDCLFWHHSCIRHKELPPNLVSNAYLIIRHMWDIQHIIFFLTFSFHWKIFIKPYCMWAWVKFTYAGHVILQPILYQLCCKTLLLAFQPYKLWILASQLHSAKEIPPNLVTHPNLIFRHLCDIQYFFLTFSYHW